MILLLARVWWHMGAKRPIFGPQEGRFPRLARFTLGHPLWQPNCNNGASGGRTGQRTRIIRLDQSVTNVRCIANW
jgi:hypothetical protein